jgi:hypothetical protein
MRKVGVVNGSSSLAHQPLDEGFDVRIERDGRPHARIIASSIVMP